MAASLGLAVSLVGVDARADGISDLRAALTRLQGHDPIRAEVELNLWKRKADGGSTVVTQGQCHASIEDGAGGITLRLSAALRDQAQREDLERVKHPDLPAPKGDCMDEMGSRRVPEYLGYAPALLRVLEQSHLEKEEPATLGDKPARLLRFRSEPSLPSSIKKQLNRLDTDVRIWIDQDGSPLAADINYSYKGSKMLIGFSGGHKQHIELKPQRERLLVVQDDVEEHFQGFGQDTQSHRLFKIRVK